MRIVVLAGGIGGARFLLGVRAMRGASAPRSRRWSTSATTCRMHGLRICPDLDSVMYTLGGARRPGARLGPASARPGWSRRSWPRTARSRPGSASATRTPPPIWCARRMLDAGYPLSAVTAALCDRWQPGVTMLPATDDRLETHVVVDVDGRAQGDPLPGVVGALPRRRADAPVRLRRRRDRQAGRRACSRRSARADVVLVAPSNPVVSIAPILAVPQLREAVVDGPAPVVGVSPIIGGAPVRGMADRCLADARRRGAARPAWAASTAPAPTDGLLDGWLVDTTDAGTDVPGVTTRAVPLWMTDEDGRRRRWCAAALDAGGGGAMMRRPRGPAGPRHRRRDRRATTWPR